MKVDRWTCGHEAGAACAECFRELAAKAAALQETVDRYEKALSRAENMFSGNRDRMRVLRFVRDYLTEDEGP